MFAVAYPSSLPAPSLWAGQPFDRAARSPLPGNTQLRGRSRDAMQDIDAAWVYSAAEMAAWVAWYDNTLLDGMRWFAMVAPGSGGFVARVLKFRTGTLRRELLGNGHWRISAKMQQRGHSAAPALPCVAETFVDGLSPYSTVSGSAALFTTVASPYGTALHYLGATSATVSAIRRTLAATACGRFKCKFLVESASVDDAGLISAQTAASAGIVTVATRRENTFDAAQRVWVILGGETVQVGTAAAALNVWHQLEVVVVRGAGNSTYSVSRLDTLAVLGSGTFASDHGTLAIAAALKFYDDPVLGSAATRFADIEICPA